MATARVAWCRAPGVQQIAGASWERMMPSAAMACWEALPGAVDLKQDFFGEILGIQWEKNIVGIQ